MAIPAKPRSAAAKKPTKKAAKVTSTPIESKKTAAAKSAVEAAPKPVVVTSTDPSVSAPMMKKKELLDAVTERSGVKRRDVKPAVEAMLAILGQALAEGRELNLQPLGKVKINRAKEVQGGRVLITKVRQSDNVAKPKDPLAEAAE